MMLRKVMLLVLIAFALSIVLPAQSVIAGEVRGAQLLAQGSARKGASNTEQLKGKKHKKPRKHKKRHHKKARKRHGKKHARRTKDHQPNR